MHSNDEQCWRTQTAPGSDEIIWGNLKLRYWEKVGGSRAGSRAGSRGAAGGQPGQGQEGSKAHGSAASSGAAVHGTA